MKNQKIKLVQAFDGVVGEARLVFEHRAPAETAASVRADTAGQNPAESPHAHETLAAAVGQQARKMAEEKLGKTVDWDRVSQDPAAQEKTIGDLSQSWDQLSKEWDRFCAVLGAIFKIPSSQIGDAVRAAEPGQQQPGAASDEVRPLPEDVERNPLAADDEKRAQHAAQVLAGKPEWKAAIEKTGRTFDIPAGTLVSFLEMESGFNPKARPGINPKTGKRYSHAQGLAQAMAGSLEEYKKNRYEQFKQENPSLGLAPAADAQHPATAIDFMGWHIVQKIKAVNAAVDRSRPEQNFPATYKLTTRSDVRYLYMAYNNGERGYLVLRRYLDHPTEENRKKLTDFQTDKVVDKNGRETDGWKFRAQYADRVARVAAIYEILGSNAPAFDSPPLAGSFSVSSQYGARMHPTENYSHFHNGIDLPAPMGAPVLAVKAGVVEKVVLWSGKKEDESGTFVTVRHENGVSKYCHLSATAAGLSVGDRVAAGVEIGKVGSTGRSTGPHLHFMWQGPDGVTRNPQASIMAISKQKTA